MITEHYLINKKPETFNENVSNWYVPKIDAAVGAVKVFDIASAKARNITLEELVRRDACVREQVANCPYKVGDLVYPHNLKLVAEYGMCKVKGIVQTYLALPLDEPWPDSDLPYLVHAYPLRTPSAPPFNATTNFFQKEYPKK